MITTVRSTKQQIVDVLRSDILCANIYPGVRLSEMELAKRFGVSRGPIREALSQLVYEGLLVSKPNCGVTVAPLPTDEIRNLVFPIRRTIELFALKQCFDRLTPSDFLAWEDLLDQMDKACREQDEKKIVALDIDFHRSIVARAGKPEIMVLWQAVVAPIRGQFAKTVSQYIATDRLDEVIDDHRNLVDVFRKGNLKAAVAALRQHVAGLISP